MDDETLAAAISLTAWAIKDAETSGSLEEAIVNMKRIYGFLADVDMSETV
jgi:hypothetical protein